MLVDISPLHFAAVQSWCDQHIPAQDIIFKDDLVQALCLALGISEHDLCIRVQEEFLNPKSFCYTTVQRWTELCEMSSLQLLTHYSTIGSKVDGLFVWLATVVMHTHLNFVHDNGVWTTCTMEKADMRDTLTVDTEKHFLATPTQNGRVTKVEMYDGFNDPDDTKAQFVDCPIVLNHPVRNIAA